MSLDLIINNGKDFSELTSVECEQSLLAALIKKNFIYDELYKILKPAYFCHKVYGDLYKKISRSIDAGTTIDVVMLKNHFDCNEELKELGGIDYLVQLSECFISFSNCKSYAEHLRNLYFNRAMIRIYHEQVRKIFTNPDKDAFEYMEDALQDLHKLSTEGIFEDDDSSMESIGDSNLKRIEEAYKNKGANTLKSGFHEIDQLTGGFRPGKLIIIADRPAMGKSALALNMAHNIALASQQQRPGGGSVAFFSIEMSKEDLHTRLLAEYTTITSDRMNNASFDAVDFAKIFEASQNLKDLPLEIFQGDHSVASIRMAARQVKRKRGLDLIIVDYLGLLQKSSDENKYNNRVQEISEITRALKRLAIELKIPVIALSQLSRNTENRDDKRPHLSDLRDSGSIEQDADIVGFVYREEYYLVREEPSSTDFEAWAKWEKKKEEAKNKAEFIVAKNRSGKTGIAKLHFNGDLTKFSNLEVEKS